MSQQLSFLGVRAGQMVHAGSSRRGRSRSRIASAISQWTAVVCMTLGGVPVHAAPPSPPPLESVPASAVEAPPQAGARLSRSEGVWTWREGWREAVVTAVGVSADQVLRQARHCGLATERDGVPQTFTVIRYPWFEHHKLMRIVPEQGSRPLVAGQRVLVHLTPCDLRVVY